MSAVRLIITDVSLVANHVVVVEAFVQLVFLVVTIGAMTKVKLSHGVRVRHRVHRIGGPHDGTPLVMPQIGRVHIVHHLMILVGLHLLLVRVALSHLLLHS